MKAQHRALDTLAIVRRRDEEQSLTRVTSAKLAQADAQRVLALATQGLTRAAEDLERARMRVEVGLREETEVGQMASAGRAFQCAQGACDEARRGLELARSALSDADLEVDQTTRAATTAATDRKVVELRVEAVEASMRAETEARAEEELDEQHASRATGR